MSTERLVLVFHNKFMDELKGHPVQIAVQRQGTNVADMTYLSTAEALTLYHRLGDYLIQHKEVNA